ncbi:MAG: tetratricopeptide repeat protein [Nitrospinae bacterium]|nr:tetratricopeptide repeat protein [Nitrospinota bacterium]
MPAINKKMKFLIVDDMSNMRRTIRNMLRYLGYEYISEAEDGNTALNKLKSEKADFIIADWNMPRMSGIELLRMLRDNENLKDIPFLMITAEVEASQILQAAETEVDGYIIKPFIAKTLEEKITNILEKRLNPAEVDKLMNNAMKYSENREYQKAIFIYEEALKLNPKSARIRHAIGQMYEKMGMDEKALNYYEDAFKNNPQYIKVHQSMGDLYLKKGDTGKAIEAIEKAVHISPNNPHRQAQLGKIYLSKGDIEKAGKAFKTAIKVDPKNAELQTDIGEAYLQSGLDEMAAEAFKGSLTVTESVHVYNRLGIALRRKGKYLEAIEEYKKALRLDPDDEAVHYNMGRAYIEADMKSEAISSFKKALQIDPYFKECKEMLEGLEKKT